MAEQVEPIQCWAGYNVAPTGKPPSAAAVREQLDAGVTAVWMPVAMHANTLFSQVEVPPCDRGITWSIVNSSPPGWQPQYWQAQWSRLNTLRRLKLTACCALHCSYHQPGVRPKKF